MTRERVCCFCRFWEDRQGLGACRRRAPIIVEGLLDTATRIEEPPEEEGERWVSRADATWPVTVEEDWCGEWEESHDARRGIATDDEQS